MSRKLHPIRGKNTFCGPSAIATVLGLTTDHAARVLRSISGDKRVTGVYPTHLVQALCALGCDVEYVQVLPAERVRVRQWLESNARLFENQHVVIDFSSHFGTLLGGHYQCSMTRSPIYWASDFIPCEEGELAGYVVIRRVPDDSPSDETAEAVRLLQQARRLAARNGIVIVRECSDTYRVTCPELEEDDPHEGRQEARTAQEVLDMVKDYVHCLRNGYLEAVTDERLWNYPSGQGAAQPLGGGTVLS